jgi:hypothetical protein
MTINCCWTSNASHLTKNYDKHCLICTKPGRKCPNVMICPRKEDAQTGGGRGRGGSRRVLNPQHQLPLLRGHPGRLGTRVPPECTLSMDPQKRWERISSGVILLWRYVAVGELFLRLLAFRLLQAQLHGGLR